MNHSLLRCLCFLTLLLATAALAAASPVVTHLSFLHMATVSHADDPHQPVAKNANRWPGGSGVMQRQSFNRSLEGTARCQGCSVSIRTNASELKVVRGTDGQVHARARLSFWSNREHLIKKAQEQFDLHVVGSGDTVRVEVPPIALKVMGGKVQYEIRVTVTVPAGTSLEINNRYGDVSVTDIGGPARVHCASGSVELTGARGPVELQARYGSIVAVDIEGDLRAATTSGKLEVRQVSGSASLGNSYGDIKVQEVGGQLTAVATSGGVTAVDLHGPAEISSSYADVSVQRAAGPVQAKASSGKVKVIGLQRGASLTSSYGSVTAEQVTGDLRVTSTSGGARITDVEGSLTLSASYDDVVARRIGGPAEIRVESGGITAENIGGDLTASCTYGAVRAIDIRGDLRLTASSTAVYAERIAGGADITTSYAGVTVQGVGGPVQVQNRSGAATVRDLTGGAVTAAHRIETSYGDIELTWPAGSEPSYQLECTYGQVRSDLPGSFRESGSRKTMQHTTESGQARVTLIAKSGSVTLRRRR